VAAIKNFINEEDYK